jgi:hypothetical protein
MSLRRIKRVLSVHGFKGSEFNKNLKSPVSKVNKESSLES